MKTLDEITAELDRIHKDAIDIQRQKDFDVFYMGRLVGAGQALMWIIGEGTTPTSRALVNKTLTNLKAS